MSRKLIGTFHGIPMWSDDDCPKDRVYIIPAESDRIAAMRRILGEHFKYVVAIKDIVEIGHCACGALLVAGKCIRCEEEGRGG